MVGAAHTHTRKRLPLRGGVVEIEIETKRDASSLLVVVVVVGGCCARRSTPGETAHAQRGGQREQWRSQ